MGRAGHFKMGVGPIAGGGGVGTPDTGRGRQPIDRNNGRGSSDATKQTGRSNTGSMQFGAANYGGGGGGIPNFASMGMLAARVK